MNNDCPVDAVSNNYVCGPSQGDCDAEEQGLEEENGPAQTTDDQVIGRIVLARGEVSIWRHSWWRSRCRMRYISKAADT